MNDSGLAEPAWFSSSRSTGHHRAVASGRVSLELSEQSWLKLPKEEAAKVFLDRLERELMAQPASGSVPNLLILDSARDPSYYKVRCVGPRREAGCFIALRPQAYGAPLWGFAHLAHRALDIQSRSGG